ncbi:conserved hypothetical protein [uncultured Eubacteriales bacterium]|uniref:Endonuclease GajA/Old nuclease/RecF-like AAA domain-containing protein n=1 Tax=uncultured Eubacteriales bacterium TaxID=172733 RepID=A0A212KEQ0_9FIRM|nr:conserved hypothetical protein [uncultured Eubacteriales bacterium]
MQIQYLKIDGFKALNNFEIKFYPQETGDSLTVLIGENGAGKSSVLEAVLRIFGSFYSSKIANEYRFDFEIKYIHAVKHVYITRIEKLYSVKVSENNEVLFEQTGALNTIKKKLDSMELRILPMRLVTFYSGVNDSLNSIVNILESPYKKSWRTDVLSNLDLVYSQNPVEMEVDSAYTRYDKKFIHCQDNLIPIYLISLLFGTDSNNKGFIKNELSISENIRIRIELNLKRWEIIRERKSEEPPEAPLNKVMEALSFILDYFDGKNEFMEALYHTTSKALIDDKFIIDIDDLSLFNAPQSSIYNFLERLTALFDAKIQTRVDGVNVMDFSEGQLQLIKIFGMLSICKNEECLVLLDEPDAHMNPKWKYYIRDYIDSAVAGAVNTQILLATHDPLVINGMPKEGIKIFGKTNMGEIKIYDPNDDTMGMGIDGLLQSEYYGLKTSYDKETSTKYQERQLLYIKLINNEITQEEKQKLRRLTKEIGALPVANNTIDFLYDDFMNVFRKTEFYKKEYLEFDQLSERREKIKEIIAGLYEDIK